MERFIATRETLPNYKSQDISRASDCCPGSLKRLREVPNCEDFLKWRCDGCGEFKSTLDETEFKTLVVNDLKCPECPKCRARMEPIYKSRYRFECGTCQGYYLLVDLLPDAAVPR